MNRLPVETRDPARHQGGPNADRPPMARRWAALTAGACLTLALAGCANPLTRALSPERALSAATDERAVVAEMGQPTNRYALADGTTRLEFARGPLGYETWMVDLSPSGKVLRYEQVLGQRRFGEVRIGMGTDEVLHLLGRPAERQREFQNRETWYWRFDAYDCQWLAITFSPRGQVMQTGSLLPDPLCDVSQ